MTVTCRTCGSELSDDYARVLAPEALAAQGEVRCCPHCDEKIRRNGRVEEARAPRYSTPERVRYDPEKTSNHSSETDADHLRTDGGRCVDGKDRLNSASAIKATGGTVEHSPDEIERYLITGGCGCVWYLRSEPERAYLHSVVDGETNEIVPREHAYEIRDSDRLEATSVTDTPIERPGGPA